MIDGARQAVEYEPAWWDADVVSVDRRTAHITVVTVAPRLPFHFLPGQPVAMECDLRPRVWRYLSPANAMRTNNTIEFHVRAVPGGQVSPALAYSLQVGAVLKLAAPWAPPWREHTSLCEISCSSPAGPAWPRCAPLWSIWRARRSTTE